MYSNFLNIQKSKNLKQMKFIHRLGYYLGGFSIGLIFLAFFLSGKRASCDYGPEARVLKNISTKNHIYSESIINALANNDIDSTSLKDIIRNGNVNFTESDTKLDSCKVYIIEGKHHESDVILSVKNCEKTAIIDFKKD